MTGFQFPENIAVRPFRYRVLLGVRHLVLLHKLEAVGSRLRLANPPAIRAARRNNPRGHGIVLGDIGIVMVTSSGKGAK